MSSPRRAPLRRGRHDRGRRSGVRTRRRRANVDPTDAGRDCATMTTGMRVCLISSVHPWVNPRLVKEADALAAAGHDPVVVTKSVDEWAEARDVRLLASKRWPSVRIDLRRE